MDADAYAKYNRPEKGAQPGIYKHPDVEDMLEVSEFPAADALVRQGWEFVKPAPSAAEKAAAAAEAARAGGETYEPSDKKK